MESSLDTYLGRSAPSESWTVAARRYPCLPSVQGWQMVTDVEGVKVTNSVCFMTDFLIRYLDHLKRI